MVLTGIYLAILHGVVYLPYLPTPYSDRKIYKVLIWGRQPTWNVKEHVSQSLPTEHIQEGQGFLQGFDSTLLGYQNTIRKES